MKYLRTHFLFFIISIPYLNIIDYYHIILSEELRYFVRFIPLVRGGYALAIIVGRFTNSKVTSLFISYLTMLLATVYFSSLLFFSIEQGLNPGVKEYTDSLWWAFMNVTTVGSNIYAVTVAGKILSVVLAALGMMMFPIFTVYITSVVQKVNSKST
ncbi:ion channel [Paenimyroides tangerinum]|nr:ion channel [Paenimyroides tangerinum]